MILKHPFTKLVITVLLWLAAAQVFNIYWQRQNEPHNVPVKSCHADLKQLQIAKEQWAIDHPDLDSKGISPKLSDLVPAYLKAARHCPSGGSYTLNDKAHYPKCSIHGTFVDIR